MYLWQAYREDMVFCFRKHKQSAEKAFNQLGDEEFFRKPGEQSNSVAIIIKHVAGNLRSRWTDVLTTDGDKPWRDRDNEFVISSEDTRAQLLAAWEQGWDTLFRTLNSLEEADVLRKIRIRGEEHTVLQAIDRSLTHVAYHTGQILYVARLIKPDGWQWITIPPGKSLEAKGRGGNYLK
jgi:uncharacterized damage-inducible protein DinB